MQKKKELSQVRNKKLRKNTVKLKKGKLQEQTMTDTDMIQNHQPQQKAKMKLWLLQRKGRKTMKTKLILLILNTFLFSCNFSKENNQCSLSKIEIHYVDMEILTVFSQPLDFR
jgi:hypothetical protein